VGGDRRAAGGVLRRCSPVISPPPAAPIGPGGRPLLGSRRALRVQPARRSLDAVVLTGGAVAFYATFPGQRPSHIDDSSSGSLPVVALLNSQIFFLFPCALPRATCEHGIVIRLLICYYVDEQLQLGAVCYVATNVLEL
jgi:hypothetical protein